ncbi:hypothetical protein [Glycomyces buryatensis]|uniref:Uncharacterized protein n=1 Tax=Glycomyces buryatensis TaxID=2570927 RepID=A0A4S8Q880_9ACTN|nr:hypothetical protein [Glycomyces buryatensis]THV40478.1 hypothetical protein FAB82_14480 [Glycomyces buryatensis]
MSRKRTARIALLALATASATAGCSLFGGEEELDFSANEDRLTDMYNESVRLTNELDAAGDRIVQTCLEDRGFTVHSPDEFTDTTSDERDSFLSQPPYDSWLLTADDAAVRGFWQWTSAEGAEEFFSDELWDLHDQDIVAGLEDDGMGWMAEEFLGEADEPDSEFFALSAEDQFAWYTAYMGEEWATEHRGELIGVEHSEDDYTNPPLGGCELEMIEAVYGGVTASENDEEGWTEWTARPPAPVGDFEEIEARYLDGIADAEPDYLDCLDGRGWGRWEFAVGRLAVNEYLEAAGWGSAVASIAYGEGTWADPPEDVPAADDLEGWFAFETDMALNFSECGDETGYRDAAEHAWQQAQLGYYVDIEDETYAWQEEMKGYLETAQDLM